jgi:putative nucleotidyltransferase with HDIG domain
MSVTATTETALDPLPLLKGLASLRKLTGMYPAGHPAITQKLDELDTCVQRHLRSADVVRIDVIHGDVHLDGLSFRHDSEANTRIVQELSGLGVDSIHIRRGVTPAELQGLAAFLWDMKNGDTGPPVAVQLAERGIRHASLGKLVALDTRWSAEQWDEAPHDVYDPAYAESLDLMQDTFSQVQDGRDLDIDTVRHVVDLLIRKVAGSSAALAQILAVKLYENLTYCHSVNVATLSLLIANQVGLDERTTAAIGEAALLHDIGKTRIPLDVIRKPGALDKRERALMESHTTYGAEILVEVEGLRPLTPTVALEHHRGAKGNGYPDVGERPPHLMSQIVAVADIYEAMTGARTYQNPSQPEQACLVLARLAGGKLNAALVKAFVAAVTFFPVGSIVRTNRDELGVVVATNPLEPLHPTIALAGADFRRLGDVDTAVREESGGYARHIVETLARVEGLEVRRFVNPESRINP